MEGRNGSRPGRGIKDERDGDGSKKGGGGINRNLE